MDTNLKILYVDDVATVRKVLKKSLAAKNCHNIEEAENGAEALEKIIAAEAKLIQKQQNEMNALKKKLEANLNERLKLRETEHNKLLQRY